MLIYCSASFRYGPLLSVVMSVYIAHKQCVSSITIKAAYRDTRFISVLATTVLTSAVSRAAHSRDPNLRGR